MKKIIHWATLAGWDVIHAHLWYMLRYSRHPEKYPLELRYRRAQKTITKVLRIMHADIHVEGMENYTNLKDKVVCISNHLSVLDPLIYISMFEKPLTFATKIETADMPFIKTYVKALDAICLDRGHLLEQQKAIAEMIRRIENKDEPNYVIFAEGTRNRNIKKGTLDFKPGTFKVAYKAGAPILPIAIFGTQRFIDDKMKMKSYPVQIKIFKPIMPSDYKDIKTVELAPRVEKMINDEITKMKKRDIEYINQMKLSDKLKKIITDVDYPLDSEENK